jgi:hypothetical protein
MSEHIAIRRSTEVNMPNIIILIALAIGILITASSCDNKPVLVTSTIFPTENYIKSHSTEDDNCWTGYCGCNMGYGKSCAFSGWAYRPNSTKFVDLIPDNPSAHSSRVGYEYSDDEGTPPFACWHHQTCIWRSYFKFDFSTLPSKNVVTAVLHFDTNQIDRQHDGIATNAGPCRVKLYVAEGPYEPEHYHVTPYEQLYNVLVMINQPT